MTGGITDITGITVGHCTDTENLTGCTVILCPEGAVGGVDVRGSAPGTRETDLLRPQSHVPTVNAFMLSGGSAYGLASATGVMNYLQERGIGYNAGSIQVPIVPAAIIFDQGVARSNAYPGEKEGYQACLNASDGPIEEGSVGAATGATVAKLLGPHNTQPGGVGTASVDLGDGLVVGAIVVVNAVGGIYNPDDGRIISGPRLANGEMGDSIKELLAIDYVSPQPFGTNTTIGVVATNATLSKVQANQLAAVAHNGIALAVRPAHTPYDGDTIFGLATGNIKGEPDMTRIGAAVVKCVGDAIISGVAKAVGYHNQ